MQRAATSRGYPVGAEVGVAGVHFRVWAPRRKRVRVVVHDIEHPLAREDDGYFAAEIDGLGAGASYGFLLDDDPKLYPDPASRSQPNGPHGLSVVVDPHAYAWRDENWRGVTASDVVISEIHIGTFTAEGTYAAAEQHLGHLREVGITALELMPLSEFPGRFGWGYDGVDLFAPTHLYGTPDDLRHFVDAAHAQNLAVLLDVVYNHLGPDGNYLDVFSPDYFTERYENDWGQAINFDGEHAQPV